MTNVDRTAQNPNLLWWHGRLWLIDHGAALFFHHAAEPDVEHARNAFDVAAHVLLPYASSLDAARERLAPKITDALLEEVTATVPTEWLDADDRRPYVDYLLIRNDVV